MKDRQLASAANACIKNGVYVHTTLERKGQTIDRSSFFLEVPMMMSTHTQSEVSNVDTPGRPIGKQRLSLGSIRSLCI